MEGRELAKSFDAPFFETSAKSRINVEEGFFQLVREIRKWNKKNESEELEVQQTTKKKGKCIII